MLIIFTINRRHRHIRLFPCQDTTFEIDALITDIRQFTSSIGRAATTTAIDRNRLAFRKFGLSLFHEVALELVDQDGALDMPFGKLVDLPHVKNHHVGVGYQFCKRSHFHVLKILCSARALLATGCRQPKCGKQVKIFFISVS